MSESVGEGGVRGVVCERGGVWRGGCGEAWRELLGWGGAVWGRGIR